MTLASQDNLLMKTYRNLYRQVCSEDNLELAWRKARKGKTLRQYIIDFEENIEDNLALLKTELLLHSYRPLPLKTFTLRDPKTRKISISDFRDRVVHHAICNVIEPLFDKTFIYDSYANRKGKGTLAAIKRLEKFQRKVSHNRTIIKKFNQKDNFRGFFFKGDIKHYFDTISHEKLMEIIKRKIKDKKLLFLIKNILNNHNLKEDGKGMPLGNLTSQFLANVYLNELDQFVKHQLKAKYYLRYVDDFVILDNDEKRLYFYEEKINHFIKNHLSIELNDDKVKIKPLQRGIEFLGFRAFYYHKLLRKRSPGRFHCKLDLLEEKYKFREVDYDTVYDFLEGWCAYAKNADTYGLRNKMLESVEERFVGEISTKEVNKGRHFLFISNPT